MVSLRPLAVMCCLSGNLFKFQYSGFENMLITKPIIYNRLRLKALAHFAKFVCLSCTSKRDVLYDADTRIRTSTEPLMTFSQCQVWRLCITIWKLGTKGTEKHCLGSKGMSWHESLSQWDLTGSLKEIFRLTVQFWFERIAGDRNLEKRVPREASLQQRP